MTDKNNAAQAAEHDPLSDEYVNAVIRQHGYYSPESVIAQLWQWIGLNGGENSVTLLMYEAHKVLSKLRAVGVEAGDEETPPIAPDDEAISDAWMTASDIDGIAYDGPSFERGYRAALASAPVAGEAQPVAEVVSRYGDPEAFGERDLKVLVDLNSYPYGTQFYAAPQASVPISHYECGRSNGDGTYEAVPVRAAPQASAATIASADNGDDAPCRPSPPSSDASALTALLDHPLLREILGYLEVAGPSDIRGLGQAWMAERNAILGKQPSDGEKWAMRDTLPPEAREGKPRWRPTAVEWDASIAAQQSGRVER